MKTGMERLKAIIAVFCAALMITACGEKSTGATFKPGENGEVNVYSARHYDTDISLYQNFSRQTGIKVNYIEAGSDALMERITNEGKYSPADVLITVDAGRLYRAEQRGLFSEVVSETLAERIPAHLRHPDNLWFGLSKRARVIIYNKAQGVPQGLENYIDLAKPEFENELCMRSSSNIYNISLLASLVSHHGLEAAETWAKGVVNNLIHKPQGNDTSNIKAVATGQCWISLVNSYYLARIAQKSPNVLDAVGVIFPNQKTSGTHINISGAGVLKYAPNRENAILFLEYLVSDDAQRAFVIGNHEYPAVKGVTGSATVQKLGTFKEDVLNASELGRHQADAVKAFDKAGWD